MKFVHKRYSRRRGLHRYSLGSWELFIYTHGQIWPLHLILGCLWFEFGLTWNKDLHYLSKTRHFWLPFGSIFWHPRGTR